MSEYFAFKKHYKETIAALTLAKCLRQRMWEDSTNLLKQLHGVGTMTARVRKTEPMQAANSPGVDERRYIIKECSW